MVNEVVLIGRLGRDPEIKRTQAGKQFCTFSLATTFGRGDKERTEWHRIEVWTSAAEACERYLRRGSKVYVKGQLKSNEWERDGQTRKDWSIVAYQVLFLDSKEGSHGR